MKNKKAIVHSPMNQFKHRNGELLVNDVPLTRLALRAGQTPFYAYDKSVVSSKIADFKRLMPSELNLHYAIKANPMPALIDFISPMVDGLDVASGTELTHALNSNTPNHHISFAGPGKSERELTMAVAGGCTVNVESMTELTRIAELSEKTGIQGNVAIRVNPDFELKSSGMKMGGGAQQFGIDAEAVPQALGKIQEFGLAYQGLHIFTGSQNLKTESLIQAHTNLFELASRLQREAPSPIKTLNIGGGLGVPYFPGDKPLSISPIGEALIPHIEKFTSEFGKVDIAMELGRYLVAEAGIYVCEVTDIKVSRGVTYAVVNGGMHQHLAASGNFGQVVRKNYPVALGNKVDEAIAGPVQVVGPLCTPLDILANQYPLPALELGDLVVVYQSGAYGYSASPRDFLSHPNPVEILV